MDTTTTRTHEWFDVRTDGDTVVLAASRDDAMVVHPADVDEWWRQFDRHVRASERVHVVADFSAVEFCGLTAFLFLDVLAHDLRAEGGSLRLVGVRQHISCALQAFGIWPIGRSASDSGTAATPPAGELRLVA